jgi:hypothetical protein
LENEIWPAKVRFDPPTLREAIFAAEGLTGDVEQQAEIAAALMEMSVEDVRAELSTVIPAHYSTQIVTSIGRDGGARMVIVERKPSRHFTVGMGALRPGPAKPLAAAQASTEDRQSSQTLLRCGLLGRKPVLA